MNDARKPQHDQPGIARGAATLLGATESARRAGYSNEFTAHEDGKIRCGACDSSFDASALAVVHEQRLEGASDVADLMLVVTGPCPVCEEGGSLILGYGPNASRADAVVLDRLNLADAVPLPEPPG